MSGPTRLGRLIIAVLEGEEVPGVSESEVARLSRDLSALEPPRSLRARRQSDGRFTVAIVGAGARR